MRANVIRQGLSVSSLHSFASDCQACLNWVIIVRTREIVVCTYLRYAKYKSSPSSGTCFVDHSTRIRTFLLVDCVPARGRSNLVCITPLSRRIRKAVSVSYEKRSRALHTFELLYVHHTAVMSHIVRHDHVAVPMLVISGHYCGACAGSP